MLLVRRRDPHRRDRAAMIDSLILTVGFALLSWVFLVAPNLHLSGLTPSSRRLVSVAYPLGDVLLLAAADQLRGPRRQARARVLPPRREHRRAARDRLRLQLRAPRRDLPPPADLRRRLDRLSRPVGYRRAPPVDADARGARAEKRVRLSPARLAQLALACLIAPAIHFAQEIKNPDLLVIIGASAILFLLVVLRMAGLVRHEERATARELALRRAGFDLVAAVGRATSTTPSRSRPPTSSATAATVRLLSPRRTDRARRVERSPAAGDVSTPTQPDGASWR